MPQLLFPKAAARCDALHGFGFQICTLSDVPPDGDDWLHQVKHDGWRVFVSVNAGGELKVASRNGYDMTDQFAMPVKQLGALGRPMIIDGEIAVPNSHGLTHLDWLHDARTRHRPDRLAFFAFDLLYLDGFDLRRRPLEQRIACLDQLIADAGCSRVLSVGYVIGKGAEFFAKARDAGAEGVVSKRLGKPYISGDSPHWLKTKVNQTGRFVVTGFETELGKLKAIHVAEERDGELRPQGRVKFGLAGLFDPLNAIRARYPGYRDRNGVVPVKPCLYVDVKYFGRIARAGKIPGGALRDGVVVWFYTVDAPARQPLAPVNWWACDTPAMIAAMDSAVDAKSGTENWSRLPGRDRSGSGRAPDRSRAPISVNGL